MYMCGYVCVWVCVYIKTVDLSTLADNYIVLFVKHKAETDLNV